MEKRAVTAVVLGASGRGKLYGDYALEHPEDLKIVGIAELVDLRRTMYGDKYGVPVENRVATWQQMLDRPKFADAVIIATPDHLHYEPCMRALDLGYDILLEKPIAQTFDECRRLVAHARDKKKIVCLTHVLRYSPYFLKLKEMIDTKRIGDLVSIQHFEPVDHIHMSHSYVRGSWHDSVKSTPLVLAKSSHDLDILYWMIGKPCRRIAAFGGLKHFKSENAPKGSTERCTDGCAAEATCPFSALKIYYRDRTWLYVFDLPEEEPDAPLGDYTGAGVICGVTGGVTEAVIRRVLDDASPNTLQTIAECGVRGLEGIKAFTVTAGDLTIRIAVANGLANADKLIAKVESGEEQFDFIEVMACPNGCIGGGGQPPACNKRKAERAEAIFKADEACALRIPQQNPDLGYVYDTLLQGRAHELLHIHYPAHGQHS